MTKSKADKKDDMIKGSEKALKYKGKSVKCDKLLVWKVLTLVFVVLFVVSVMTSGFRGSSSAVSAGSADAVAQEAIEYINANVLQGGSKIVLKDSKVVEGIYVLSLELDGNQFESYVSPDGKLLFPQAINMVETPTTTPPQATATPPQDVPKSDKPVVELFVMSHCPFGTQAEKGMIPVVELLGDKIDFNLRFVNYAMHGEKEVVEQLNQYCIQKEQNDKFLPYMRCFLEADEAEKCLSEVGIDQDAMKACYDKTDEELGIMASLADKSTWSGGRFPPFAVDDALNTKYGVRGSPTLVINGAQVRSGRDSASYLGAICSAFNEAPAECEKELSSTSPSPGFGWEGSGSANAATCG